VTKRATRPVVVAIPTDGDFGAVLRYAVVEVRVHRCDLRLVHAHTPGDGSHPDAVLQRAVDVARLMTGPTARIDARLVAGPAVKAVLSASPDARVVVLRRRDSLEHDPRLS
jgi:hypothetical protein